MQSIRRPGWPIQPAGLSPLSFASPVFTGFADMNQQPAGLFRGIHSAKFSPFGFASPAFAGFAL